MNVIVLRGLPGSGKSHYAKSIPGNTVTVSADHFFINSEGEYVFDSTKLGAAHAYCFRSYLKLLQHGKADTIIVDNTNTSAVEISPYMLTAAAFNCEARVVTVECDKDIAAARNIHDVPVEIVHKLHAQLSVPLPPWWTHDVVRDGVEVPIS